MENKAKTKIPARYLTYEDKENRKYSPKYIQFLEESYGKSEKECDELKLKEQIAHDAKETAQDAYQKLVKERDGLKDDCGEMAMTISNLDGLQETYLEELQALKDKVEELEFRNEHLQEQLNEYNEYKSVKDLQTMKDAVRNEREKYTEYCKVNGDDSVDIGTVYEFRTEWMKARDKLKPLIK